MYDNCPFCTSKILLVITPFSCPYCHGDLEITPEGNLIGVKDNRKPLTAEDRMGLREGG